MEKVFPYNAKHRNQEDQKRVSEEQNKQNIQRGGVDVEKTV